MTRLHNNIILMTDSYKLSHFKQYRPGTQSVYSYFESRHGAEFPYTVFFGLQYLLKKYLEGQVITRDAIDQADRVARIHVDLGDQSFNKEGWEYILRRHNGHLPVRIKAVPEGTPVETGNVLMTIENTDPNCYWLPNYLETLLVQAWYPSTVATLSHQVKHKIRYGLEKTGDIDGIDFRLHDFGFRGSTTVESAGIGGLAHLINFSGTDTIAAIGCGIEYYDSGVCGFSIPATEHSTITSWGKDGEVDAYRNLLQQYPTGTIACVSDSFNIDHACSELWGRQLKEEVLQRNGVLVVRPDSGEVVPMVLNVLERLGNAFGTYVNEHGYRVLNDKVRVIQGDGCTIETIANIIDSMIEAEWSIDNIVFGMGGGLLQKVDRDTQRFAFKCSHTVCDGQSLDVYKQPVSDPAKASKRGRLKLIYNDSVGSYLTVPEMDPNPDQMRVVFEHGEVIVRDTFDNIRQRAQRRMDRSAIVSVR